MDAPHRLPGAPPDGEPVETGPIDGFSMESFATLGVALAVSGRPRKELLAEQGLDEMRWAWIEAGWMTRIAVLALRDDTSLADRHRQLTAAALDAFARDLPLPDEATWARVVAATRAGMPPAEAARREGLSTIAFVRAQSTYAQRFGRDPEARAAFEAEVARVAG